jgi:hypothetical protein
MPRGWVIRFSVPKLKPKGRVGNNSADMRQQPLWKVWREPGKANFIYIKGIGRELWLAPYINFHCYECEMRMARYGWRGLVCQNHCEKTR